MSCDAAFHAIEGLSILNILVQKSKNELWGLIIFPISTCSHIWSPFKRPLQWRILFVHSIWVLFYELIQCVHKAQQGPTSLWQEYQVNQSPKFFFFQFILSCLVSLNSKLQKAKVSLTMNWNYSRSSSMVQTNQAFGSLITWKNHKK